MTVRAAKPAIRDTRQSLRLSPSRKGRSGQLIGSSCSRVMSNRRRVPTYAADAWFPECMNEPKVAPLQLPPGVGELTERVLHDVREAIVVLPVRLKGDWGIYRDSHLFAVKELRANDVSARFLHDDPKDRRLLSEFSADVVAEIAVGIGSNASWDAIQMFVQYLFVLAKRVGKPAGPVRASVALLERPDGTRLEGIEVTGPTADAAARLLKELGRYIDPSS